MLPSSSAAAAVHLPISPFPSPSISQKAALLVPPSAAVVIVETVMMMMTDHHHHHHRHHHHHLAQGRVGSRPVLLRSATRRGSPGRLPCTPRPTASAARMALAHHPGGGGAAADRRPAPFEPSSWRRSAARGEGRGLRGDDPLGWRRPAPAGTISKAGEKPRGDDGPAGWRRPCALAHERR